VLIAMAALCLMPASAQAAVITPNTTADEYDTVPNSSCSLREAVQTLNTVSDFGGCTHTGTFASGDTIELPGGDYVLTIEPTGSDLNSSGDLNTFGTVTIEAAPGARVTIDGNAKDRVLNASIFGVTVTLRGLTITNGVVGTPESNTGVIGGGIFSSSGTNLVISDSTISNNTSDGGGGGIDANGPRPSPT
jgi:CSLREA domain-containing protein